MNIEVRLFAVARQLSGEESLRVELPEGATVAQLRGKLGEQAPALKAVLAQMLFAVGQEYAAEDMVLSSGDEVACIPPVSGG